MQLRRMIRSLVFLALSLPLLASSALAGELPKLGAAPDKVSISGLSSGGFMAVQYDVVYSADTMGVGVVAGGPFACDAIYLGNFAFCMQGMPSGALAYATAQMWSAAGTIDPVSNLTRHKVYLFSGTSDTVVKQSVMDAVRSFYQAAKVPGANLIYENKTDAGHAFISDHATAECTVSQAPYVNECKVKGSLYDQPGAILSQIYGPLQPKAVTLSAQPVAFDQTPFLPPLSGLASTGYAYIPASCQTAGSNCGVHVVFHGCLQSAEVPGVGDAVYGRLGYNEWADTNHIIMLYPQIDTHYALNPNGCWDWTGYTGPAFATHYGLQLSAVHAMVQRLTSQ